MYNLTIIKNNHFQIFLAFAKNEAKLFQSCDCTTLASQHFQVSDNVRPHYRGPNLSEFFLVLILWED